MKIVNIKTKAVILISMILFTFAALKVFEYIKFLENGELGGKAGYAFLQGFEYKHRHDSDIVSPILVVDNDDTGYSAIGLSIDDDRYSSDTPRVWILLNKTIKKEVMMVPGDIIPNIRCNYENISKIISNVKVEPEVIEFLKKKCTQ